MGIVNNLSSDNLASFAGTPSEMRRVPPFKLREGHTIRFSYYVVGLASIVGFHLFRFIHASVFYDYYLSTLIMLRLYCPGENK